MGSAKVTSEPQLQNLMEQIALLGRVMFHPWLITQRPAVLSKDAPQPSRTVYLAMKLTNPQDRDAWCGLKVKLIAKMKKKTLARLPTLQRGEGVWLPPWCFECIIPRKTDF